MKKQRGISHCENMKEEAFWYASALVFDDFIKKTK